MPINEVFGNSTLDDLLYGNRQQQRAGSGDELGQDAFLKLMIAQLNNQNPLDPMGNADFIAQLAQFSTVEGIDKLNNTVNKLADGFESNQALQASALVGRVVKVQMDTAYKPEGGLVAGTIDVPFTTSGLRLSVYNEAGELVWQQDLGSHEQGDFSFYWDGTRPNGEVLPAGAYRFEAMASRDGKNVQLDTWLGANVNSVTLGPNNTMTLNVAGVGPVSMSEVREIL